MGEALAMDRKERGFTLLEVVIALALLAVTLLGMFQMQLYAMRGNTLSQGTTTALHIAQDQMEALLAEPFTSAQLIDAVPGNDVTNPAVPDYTQAVNGPRGEPYTLVTNIADSGAPATTKTIGVWVLWGPGNVRRCGLTTVVRQ
jgi:prepilin-type N-terminal cleavage/methylation domain-containing protein